MALFGRKHVEEEEDVLDTSASVSQRSEERRVGKEC